MPLVSWGCHWCPEDTGVLISIKNGVFLLPPLNITQKPCGCSRKSAKVPPHPPHPGRLSLSCAARPSSLPHTLRSRPLPPHAPRLTARTVPCRVLPNVSVFD
eukprot:scaffold17747_cov92-Phaeocystis_antarctica.AAC.2